MATCCLHSRPLSDLSRDSGLFRVLLGSIPPQVVARASASCWLSARGHPPQLPADLPKASEGESLSVSIVLMEERQLDHGLGLWAFAPALGLPHSPLAWLAVMKADVGARGQRGQSGPCVQRTVHPCSDDLRAP